MNPVPIAPTFSDSTDLTIAISLGGKPQSKLVNAIENDPVPVAKPLFNQKINEFIASFKSSTVSHISQDWGAYDVANQAFDAMQSTIARQKLAAYPPDHFIEIARNACETLEFDRASEMIDLGYQKAEETMLKLS